MPDAGRVYELAPWALSRRGRRLFRLLTCGFWMIGTKVGGELFVALGFVLLLHFIK